MKTPGGFKNFQKSLTELKKPC